MSVYALRKVRDAWEHKLINYVSSLHFGKNFVKSNYRIDWKVVFFVKAFHNPMREFFVFRKTKKFSHWKSDFFSNNVGFTNFLSKVWERISIFVSTIIMQCDQLQNFREINDLWLQLCSILISRKKWVDFEITKTQCWNYAHCAQCGKMKNLASLKKYFVKSPL